MLIEDICLLLSINKIQNVIKNQDYFFVEKQIYLQNENMLTDSLIQCYM